MNLNSLRYELHKVQGVIGLSQLRKIMAEVDAAEARIKELESAQTLQPMSEAPESEGSEVYAIVHLRRVDGLFEKLDGDDVWADGFDGWLPLPKPTT